MGGPGTAPGENCVDILEDLEITVDEEQMALIRRVEELTEVIRTAG